MYVNLSNCQSIWKSDVAEGDVMCTNSLVENEVIGDTLVSFVGVYFRCINTGNVNHLSSMLDVCEIIEISIHMEEQCGVFDASSKHTYQTLRNCFIATLLYRVIQHPVYCLHPSCNRY
jgi:hypothetical protein